MPFFPEVHEELTRSWKAPFTARSKFCSSSPSPPSLVDPLCGTRASPRWSGLWPYNCGHATASNLRGDPCLPSRACKYSSGLTGSAYRACGEAASALHAMALLQVHQAKALKDLHKGCHAACCDGPRSLSDEGDRTVSGSCDVHASGPRAPSLTVSH